MELVILIGIQGSGKTTFYTKRFLQTHVRVGLDLVKTRNREQALLKTCLETRQRCCIDNTNARAAERALYIGAAKRAGFRVTAYLLETPLKEALRRNSQRAGKAAIPVAGVIGTAKRMERPAFAEGFDEIYLVTPGEGDEFVVREWSETPPIPDARAPQVQVAAPAIETAGARCRIFLLSPANSNGARAKMLVRPEAAFDLAVRLRGEGAPLGEAFAFVSELYFRGKLAYAQAFAAPPEGIPGAFVITPGQGLIPPETPITIQHLEQFASVPVDAGDARYRIPLEKACRTLDELAGPDCEYVLLGSVATLKYLEPIVGVFGERLLFPEEFVGRGDMSRGGLLLRCARAGVQLHYAPLGTLTRHGPRPPKLPRIPRGMNSKMAPDVP